MIPAFARRTAVVLAVLVLTGCQPAGPARVPAGQSTLVDVQILAFNDFHGNLEPPTGATGRLGDQAVGGVEYLASHIARLKATNPNTVVVSAGDNVGATPLLSSLFHDEPTVLALSRVGLEFSAPGNHEFDEGWLELLRLQHGGCHPVDGCTVDESFPGASYRYLSANVRVDARNDTLFPATAMRTFAGVSVGFVGLVLRGTPGLVQPSSVAGLTFLPEAGVANAAAEQLRRDGADVIVVLIHEGGLPRAGDDEACAGMTGGLVDIVRSLTPAIDVVVSGHTNGNYICRMGGHLVTSTSSYGRQLTDIDITVDRRSGRVVSKRAANVAVTHDVPRDPAMTALIEAYRPVAIEVGRPQVGSIAATLTRVRTASGESALGNTVADAFLSVARDPARGGAQVAFMNWGGMRADLVHTGETTTPVTYADAFRTLPFGNVVIVQTVTGAQLAAILEQQFPTDSPAAWKILQVSGNFSYSWSPARPEGSRIRRDSFRLDGVPLDMTASYRVAMSDFLWTGGDGFTAGQTGTDPVAVGTDLDVFIEYLSRQSPLSPAPLNRIIREP